jgi:hypothetical protein
MLNHYDDGRKAFRKRAQYMTKRSEAARGSGKRYDVEATADAGSISCVIVRNRVSATYDSACKIIRYVNNLLGTGLQIKKLVRNVRR